MSQLTTHILDTTRGKPAADVSVYLYQQHNDNWAEITIARTNADGRIPGLLREDAQLTAGIYKLKFMTREYFESQGMTSFYPYIEIVFEISGTEHYHIPLLLNPYGYSTYRGS